MHIDQVLQPGSNARQGRTRRRGRIGKVIPANGQGIDPVVDRTQTAEVNELTGLRSSGNRHAVHPGDGTETGSRNGYDPRSIANRNDAAAGRSRVSAIGSNLTGNLSSDIREGIAADSGIGKVGTTHGHRIGSIGNDRGTGQIDSAIGCWICNIGVIYRGIGDIGHRLGCRNSNC